MRVKTALSRLALGAAAVLMVAAGPGLACGEAKGGLMLAVTTDMLAPKDVNVVAVSIQVGPQIKYNFVGRVTPEGEVLLPATLAIVEPDDPNAPIRVRVIAFQETKPRVLRDVTTTSPRAGRIALLRMPLSFINDSSATGALPEGNLPPKAGPLGTRSLRPLADPFNPYGAEVVSVCTDPDQTMIDGECASSKVDSATLPDFSESLVFPNGDRSKCFATGSCFAGWREAAVDLDTCTAPKGGEVTNVTLVTADGTGACAPTGGCFVPIDRSDEGWRDEGDRVRLPKGVCKKLRQGAKLGFVGGTTCEQKTPSLPVCTDKVPSTPPPADAGSEGGVADAVEKVAEAGGAYGLAVFSDRLYYSTTDGLFRFAGGQTQKLGFSSTSPRIAPWFLAQNTDTVVFLDGTAMVGSGDTKAFILTNDGSPGLVNFFEPIGTLPTSVALGQKSAWFGTGNSAGTDGNILRVPDIASPLSPASGHSGTPITALGHALNDHLWAGDQTGNVTICDASTASFNCSTPVPSNPATTLPIEGIAASVSGAIDQAFLLQRDGVILVKSDAIGAPILVKPLIEADDLAGVTDGNNVYFPRGIASNARCAFYGSKKGLEYISADGLSAGVLVPQQRAVVSVVAPVFATTSERWVYFIVRDAVPTGGGVYRVKVPAPCL